MFRFRFEGGEAIRRVGFLSSWHLPRNDTVTMMRTVTDGDGRWWTVTASDGRQRTVIDVEEHNGKSNKPPSRMELLYMSALGAASTLITYRPAWASTRIVYEECLCVSHPIGLHRSVRSCKQSRHQFRHGPVTCATTRRRIDVQSLPTRIAHRPCFIQRIGSYRWNEQWMT